MPDLKKRLITGTVGLVVAFTIVACDSDDGPSDTSPPGDSNTTTAPVGS